MRIKPLRIGNASRSNVRGATIDCPPPQFAHKLPPLVAARGVVGAPAARCVAGIVPRSVAGQELERA